MKESKSQFQAPLETKPSTFELETISVAIDPNVTLCDYAKAYQGELQRRNPLRYEASGIDDASLFSYFKGLLAIRVESIEDKCKVWRQAKQLLIPGFVQFALAQIGEVVDRDRGLRLVPTYSTEYDINQLLEFSRRLEAFMSDGLVLFKDAIPRNRDGDIDVMSMAIISGYVVSQKIASDPLAPYLAGFLGMKIQEEANLKMLYRIRYDDLEFIKVSLLAEGKMFQ